MIDQFLTRELDVDDFEQVITCQHDKSGLRAIVAIHNTALGPAVGGTRLLPYQTEQQALDDVLRLARAMTYKAAAAGLDFGGGKAVIIGDPDHDKSDELFEAFGQFIESLSGRFQTGEDVGTTADDMRIAARATKYTIYPPIDEEDPWQTSFLTALGTLCSIQACLNEIHGSDSLEGVHVLLQGVGKVGQQLAKLLRSHGAVMTVADVNTDRLTAFADEFEARVVDPQEIYHQPSDVFAPCALGEILNDESIPVLRCKMIAGAANNQLQEEHHGQSLWQKRILYAPDYVVNAGGLISALYEMGTCDRNTVISQTESVYERLQTVFALSRDEGIPTNQAADLIVERRLHAVNES